MGARHPWLPRDGIRGLPGWPLLAILGWEASPTILRHPSMMNSFHNTRITPAIPRTIWRLVM